MADISKRMEKVVTDEKLLGAAVELGNTMLKHGYTAAEAVDTVRYFSKFERNALPMIKEATKAYDKVYSTLGSHINVES